MSKKCSKTPHNVELRWSTLYEKTKVSNVKQILDGKKKKKAEVSCCPFTFRASESHSWHFDSDCSCHMIGNNFFSQHSQILMKEMLHLGKIM